MLTLAERPGELLTRAELHDRLWPDDTFVDFEDGLNAAMSKLREVLGDDPQSPRYIETVRGRGYRLVVPVESIARRPAEEHLSQAPIPLTQIGRNDTAQDQRASDAVARQHFSLAGQVVSVPAQRRTRHSIRFWMLMLGIILGGAGTSFWYWAMHGRPVLSFSNQDPVVIADFDNQTGDPRFDNALATALNISLSQSRHINVYSRLQAARALGLMTRKQDERITPAVGREICQRESIPGLLAPGITRTGNEYLLTAQLIDPSTGAVVRSYSEHAHGEGQILTALDSIAATVRRDLGESPYEVHRSLRPLPEVTTASLSALEDYADGGTQFGRGKADDAVRLYKAAVAADPSFAVAHAALGYAYYSFYFNQPAQGEHEFRRALELADRTTEREHSWIEVRYAESQGRIEDALQLYQAYLQQYPGDWTARYSDARLLRMHGHARESIPIYEQLIRQQPGDAGTYIELATAYMTLGQFPQSIEAYDKAFSLDPHRIESSPVNREYGFTLVRNGQDAKAEQVFSARLADPSTFADGERSLALLDLYHGHYASARQRLLLALEKSTDPFSVARIRYMLAVVAAGEGNRREQVAQLDRIMDRIDALGSKVAYGALLGQAYARAGEVEKARKLLSVVAPVVNERVEEQVEYAQLLKAEVAAASGNAKDALQFLRPNPEAGGASEALVSESLAHIYQQMGNTDEAIATYRQLLRDSSSRMLGWEPQQQVFDAYYNLALDYQRNGDRANALSSLTELLTQWSSADKDLPLLKSAYHLRDQLTASH